MPLQCPSEYRDIVSIPASNSAKYVSVFASIVMCLYSLPSAAHRCPAAVTGQSLTVKLNCFRRQAADIGRNKSGTILREIEKSAPAILVREPVSPQFAAIPAKRPVPTGILPPHAFKVVSNLMGAKLCNATQAFHLSFLPLFDGAIILSQRTEINKY
jgi:hypothetical protein